MIWRGLIMCLITGFAMGKTWWSPSDHPKQTVVSYQAFQTHLQPEERWLKWLWIKTYQNPTFQHYTVLRRCMALGLARSARSHQRISCLWMFIPVSWKVGGKTHDMDLTLLNAEIYIPQQNIYYIILSYLVVPHSPFVFPRYAPMRTTTFSESSPLMSQNSGGLWKAAGGCGQSCWQSPAGGRVSPFRKERKHSDVMLLENHYRFNYDSLLMPNMWRIYNYRNIMEYNGI